jgi:predicted nucleic acid-binding Zn ribbon protein
MENENQSPGPTKKCPKCAEDVQKDATVCKHCGAKITSSKKKKVGIGCLVIFLIIIVLIIIGGNSGDKNQKSANTTQDTNSKANTAQSDNQAVSTNNNNAQTSQPSKTAPATPDVIVTAAVIAEDYSENEVSADAKYKDKLIEISGKIYAISNGIADNEMIVSLSDGKYDMGDPACNMKASEHDKVLNFKKGQQVTLIGTGNSATLGSPQLKDCVVK